MAGCEGTYDLNEITNPRKQLSLSTKGVEYVSGGNDFSLNFTENVIAAGEKDFIVSPLSLQFLLGMLLEGADNRTADEICEVLGYGAGETADVSEYCKSMLEQLPSLDNKTTLDIADAILVGKNYEMLPSYKRSVANYYKAYVESVDFSKSSEVVNKVNNWCRRNTRGMIPKIIDKVYPETFAILLNAMYFNGKWQEKFNKSASGHETFTTESSERKELVMMKQETRFAYGWNDVFQAVRLPYGNGAYSMTVFLPLEGYKVEDIIPSLRQTGWRGFMGSMSSAIVDLWLPRFETEYSIDLPQMLSSMGMPTAFTASADFGKMTNIPVCVSDILQKAIIKVDEEGTEAAVVTIGTMKATSAGPDENGRVVFHADHPFLYVISEASTGAILFTGRFGAK